MNCGISLSRLYVFVGAGLILLMTASETRAVSLEEVKHERHSSVAGLPEFARVGKAGQTIFILRGRLSKARAKQMSKLATSLHRDVSRRFLKGTDKSGLRPVDVCLFNSSEAYRKFVTEVVDDDTFQDDLGFYVPYRRLVVADIERNLGSLRHELVHVLLRDDLGSVPYWLDEGLASLYVSVKPTKKRLHFLVNYRLNQLRAARAAGRLPDFEKLASSDDRNVYGSNHRAYYSLAQFLLLYLERQGKLEKFVRRMLSKPASTKWQLAVLNEYFDFKKFLAWTEKLKIETR
jgi:hypothetical protein